VARHRFTEFLIRSEPDASRHETIRTEFASWDDATLLNKAHITKQGRMTRAALLLLGKDEASHFLAPADTKISWVLRDAHNATVLSLDRVQKGQTLSADEIKTLRAMGLIEGRAPKVFISAKVADVAGQKARYIHNRGLDDGYYQQLVLDYLKKYGKATPTQHVWYYEHPYPPGVKNYNKTKPIRIEEFDAEKAWWGSEADGFAARVENERAWKVPIDQIKAANYNLDQKNPHIGEQASHDPEQLLADYARLQGEAQALRDELKQILAKSLASQR
jgi:hypothetical protein